MKKSFYSFFAGKKISLTSDFLASSAKVYVVAAESEMNAKDERRERRLPPPCTFGGMGAPPEIGSACLLCENFGFGALELSEFLRPDEKIFLTRQASEENL